MYLTFEEYKELDGKITDEKTFVKFEKQCSRYIDILSFNRIKSIDNCSNFEKEIIKEVMAELCDFYFSNEDYLNSYLDSYSINGVSMTFGGDNNNICTVNGVTLLKSTYNKLNMTRFTCLIL